jgi:hypothetical protein
VTKVQHGRWMWDFRTGQWRVYWGPWYLATPGQPLPGPVWPKLRIYSEL